jgi:hypothetical protein
VKEEQEDISEEGVSEELYFIALLLAATPSCTSLNLSANLSPNVFLNLLQSIHAHLFPEVLLVLLDCCCFTVPAAVAAAAPIFLPSDWLSCC